MDGWLETWTEDGIIETPFGTSKGKTSMRVFLTGYFEIAKGKRHWTSNYMIFEGEGKGKGGEVKAKSTNSTNTSVYNNASSNATTSCDLMIFKIDEMRSIFTTGTYVDRVRKVHELGNLAIAS